MDVRFSDFIIPYAPVDGKIKAFNKPDQLKEIDTALPLVMYGCGEVGESVFTLLKTNNIAVSGVFIDGNPDGQAFHGINVCNLDGICKKYPLFNVIIANLRGYCEEVIECLYNDNIANVYVINLSLFHRLETIDYGFILKNEKSFQWTYDQLSEDLSKKSYLTYLNAKVSTVYKDFMQYVRPDQYFCSDIIKLAPDEVFIDCGAYDGDSVLRFVNKAPPRGKF